MNKKILIGSIIAVVILILVSFTGVVGYQTTKSSTIAKASPLFSIRTSRAIDEESKDLTCDYVGKGNTLPFPKRDDRTESLQKLIDIIVKMDDKTFDKFIGLIINRLRQNYPITSKTISKIITSLEKLRDIHVHPVNYRIFWNTEFKDRYATEYCNTMGFCFTENKDFRCFLFDLYILMITFFLLIWVTIDYYITILFRCS